MKQIEKTIKGLEHCANCKPCNLCVFNTDCKGTSNVAMSHAISVIRSLETKNKMLKNRLDILKKIYKSTEERYKKATEVEP